MAQAKRLTSWQRRYCELRAKGMNGINAVKQIDQECGIGPRSSEHAYGCKASKLNSLPKVREYREYLERTAAERAGLTCEMVITDLMRIKDRCMQSEPVRDSQGAPTGEYQFREHGAIKALELLGRHKGMWSDKVELSGPGGGPVKIERIEIVGVEPERKDP